MWNPRTDTQLSTRPFDPVLHPQSAAYLQFMADVFFWRHRFDTARTVWPFVVKLYETVG